MKRTWITVKRGILEPKHRFALGELIWLFIYILDRTNWEAGVIEEWLDRGAAEEMEMPLSTLRDQRRKLQEKGYITCENKQHGIRVIVHNWTNPKEYTGKKYNVKNMSDTSSNIPDDTPSYTPSYTPSFEDRHEGETSSYSQKSKITNQNISDKSEPKTEPCNEDGIPESWQDRAPKRSFITGEEKRLADLIADSLGILPPICTNKKQYAAANVTWWNPIKEMLRQARGNVEEAESIADYTITEYRKAGLTMASPQSILKGFIGTIAKEKKR
jgi:hypothetical protein